MKLLMERWREFTEKELLKEFNRLDKQSLKLNGEDFTVSYEIELESRGNDGPSGPNLDVARDYWEEWDFQEYHRNNFHEQEADQYLSSVFNIDDSEDLLLWWLREEYDSSADTEINAQATMVGIIYETESAVSFELKDQIEEAMHRAVNGDLFEDAIEVLLKYVGGEEELRKAGFDLKMGSDLGKQRSLELNEEEFSQPERFPPGTQYKLGLGDMKLFIEKYLFDPKNDTRMFLPTGSDRDTKLNLSYGILNFLDDLGLDGLADDIREKAEEILDDVKEPENRSRVESLADVYHFDTPIIRNIAGTLAARIEDEVEEYIADQWREYQHDPIGFLEEMGVDTSEMFDEERSDEYFGDRQQALREHLPNFMAEYGVQLKYEEDASLENGIEFSMDNPPFMSGLDEAFNFLRLFFDDFERQDHFFMNSNTGLHTNIGYVEDRSKEDPQEYNLIKSLLFLNSDFAMKGFENRKGSRWAGDLKSAAKEAIDRWAIEKGHQNRLEIIKSEDGLKRLENVLSDKILQAARMTGSKSLGMNITYINDRDYIEFRYPGNEGPDYANMVDATLYYAHLVRLANDPNYKKHEYKKKLIGFLSNLSEAVEISIAEKKEKVKAVMGAGKGAVYKRTYLASEHSRYKKNLWRILALEFIDEIISDMSVHQKDMVLQYQGLGQPTGEVSPEEELKKVLLDEVPRTLERGLQGSSIYIYMGLKKMPGEEGQYRTLVHFKYPAGIINREWGSDDENYEFKMKDAYYTIPMFLNLINQFSPADPDLAKQYKERPAKKIRKTHHLFNVFGIAGIDLYYNHYQDSVFRELKKLAQEDSGDAPSTEGNDIGLRPG